VQIISQASACVNFFGALQQHAPADLAILDEYVHPRRDDPDWQQVTEMPKLLRTQMDDIQDLIEQLPALPDTVCSHCWLPMSENK
jgi:hypothetical protein